MPKEIDIKNILSESRSIPRNKKLVEIFHQINLVESWGTGFQRIIEECKKNDNELPEFSEKAGVFVISFKKRKEKDLEKDLENLTDNQKKIVIEITKNQDITQKELSEKVGINEKNIRNNIAELKEKGLLSRVGPDKGGYWKIISK